MPKSNEFKKIQTIAFFVLLVGVGLLFYRMLAPYLYALFWAGVIAAIFHPVYRRLLKRTGNANIASLLTVLLVVVIVLAPLAGVFTLLVKQAVDTYTLISDPDTVQRFIAWLNSVRTLPLVQDAIGNVDLSERLSSASSTIASTGIEWLKVGSSSVITAMIQVLVMLYSLYYFFKDGAQWLQYTMHLLPFGDDNEKILYEKFVSTSKATLKGTILLGGMQGALGGVLFWAVGIPSSAFWGLIMVVFAIIPAVGAFVVWFPAMIWLLATGSYVSGIIVLIGGMIIGGLDNLLRPPLVGKDIEMHPMLILFSTIGGLALFGISGVVVGPMITAFFTAVLHMYEQKYKKQLDQD